MSEPSPRASDLATWQPSSKSPLMQLREDCLNAIPEVCVERPRLVTQFHKKYGLFDKNRIGILDKARVYRDVLEHREPVVKHGSGYGQGMKPFTFTDSSPFAGSTTSKFKGVVVYPELVGLILWADLLTMSQRGLNPYHITDSDINTLNREVFPLWMERNILELTRARLYEENLAHHKEPKHCPELALMQNMVFYLTSKPLCISHTIPDFSRAVYEGLEAVMGDAAARMGETADPGQREFYNAVATVIQGILSYAERLAKKAEDLAKSETESAERSRLMEISRRYRKVPRYRADTFLEGLTTVWICWTALHLENPNVGLSLGRLDQLLYPLYQRHIEEGWKSRESGADADSPTPEQQATEWVCYLWLKIGDHVPTMTETADKLFGGTGSNQAITIGGVDAAGKDAVNDLTYVMLRATEIMQLRDPNLNARYYPPENSQTYLDRLCVVNIATAATPAIHNDKAVVAALMSKGDTEAQALDYGIVGCVEPVSAGRSYCHNAAVLINLTSALELAMYNGRHRHTGLGEERPLISEATGDPAAFKSFEEFYAAFEQQARWLIDRATYLNNELGRTHQDFYPTPILSALFKGPMEKGKDLIQGGAEINASGGAIIGLADTADSLSAIKSVVFPETGLKRVTFPQLLAAMHDNFEADKSQEILHTWLVNCPKYGNEDQKADLMVHGLVNLLDDAFSHKPNYRGGHYRVGYWTMTIHAGMAMLTGALPNGRKKGESFASGITPVSGVTPHLTKALNSVADLPAPALSSGVALNLKFTPRPGDTKAMVNDLAARVKAFVREGTKETGGMEIQFNITEREIFENLANDPVKFTLAYPKLRNKLVRVSGYTAYFVDLSPQMQKEIIERTEYELSTGKAKPFKPFVPPVQASGLDLDKILAGLEGLSGKVPPGAVRRLIDYLVGGITDNTLEGLLKGMELAFFLSNSFLDTQWLLGDRLKDYHRNIENFRGRYLFEARNGAEVGVVFQSGEMEVIDDGIQEWDIKITFEDDWALLRFLLKGSDGEVMDEILGHTVEAEGNLNYLFKFGFMVRDLLCRFGILRRAADA